MAFCEFECMFYGLLLKKIGRVYEKRASDEKGL